MTKSPSKLTAFRGNRSLGAVAADVGISASSLSAYESGKRVPRDDIKRRLSEFYGVALSELFPHEPTAGNAKNLHDSVAAMDADQLSDFSDLMRALSPDEADVTTIMKDVRRLVMLRRVAKRNGIIIQKRFNRSFGESAYMLIGAANNFVIAGSDPAPYSLSLDDVENWLSTIDAAGMDINAQTVPPVSSHAEATAILAHNTHRRSAK